MKKVLAVAVFSAIVAAPAFAAKKSSSDYQYAVGAGYGFGNNGVLSFRGDYDIADRVNAPVKARVGWEHYSTDKVSVPFFGDYQISYNVYYAGAYYDLNEILKLDKKIRPFAGVGLGFETASCTGTFCSGQSVSSGLELYYIGGLQYNLTPNIDAEASFGRWTGISLGANYKF